MGGPLCTAGDADGAVAIRGGLPDIWSLAGVLGPPFPPPGGPAGDAVIAAGLLLAVLGG